MILQQRSKFELQRSKTIMLKGDGRQLISALLLYFVRGGYLAANKSLGVLLYHFAGFLGKPKISNRVIRL